MPRDYVLKPVDEADDFDLGESATVRNQAFKKAVIDESSDFDTGDAAESSPTQAAIPMPSRIDESEVAMIEEAPAIPKVRHEPEPMGPWFDESRMPSKPVEEIPQAELQGHLTYLDNVSGMTRCDETRRVQWRRKIGAAFFAIQQGMQAPQITPQPLPAWHRNQARDIEALKNHLVNL